MRTFLNQSVFADGNLALALAPALTPTGVVQDPYFFRGVAVHPVVLARGLLVLADIASTRYFRYTPEAERDPVLSAQGDRLRAECFSVDNGVYARLDLLQSGFDGEIALGTTNVDIGIALRTALMKVRQGDKLYVNIGGGGLAMAHTESADEKTVRVMSKVQERPVQMPDRWVRALGNSAEIHHEMRPVFRLAGACAQAFVASLPPATGKQQAGWLAPTATRAKLMRCRTADAVYVSGLHRLSALKRVLTNLSAMTFYASADGEPGQFMAEAELPGARLTISLTAEAWQGYSGEGALLEALAQQEALEDAESIASMLAFDAALDKGKIERLWGLSDRRTDAALALLAVSGKLGYDAHDGAYFHRELPDDPERALKDNPRLVAARALADKVKKTGENQWLVHSGGVDYRVTLGENNEAKCTCIWYLNHQNRRGPCKHILAVRLESEK